MSPAIAPKQLLELITSVFNGKSVENVNGFYTFSDEFFPDTQITDESTYLQLKQFEFDVKYDFLFNMTKTISDLVGDFSTLSDRDSLIDNFYGQFKDIVKNPKTGLTVLRYGTKIVSLVIGSYLPLTNGLTTYDTWAIPEEAQAFTTLELDPDYPNVTQGAVTSQQTDGGLIVISEKYLRVGPLELCGDRFNLLINTKNKKLFATNETSNYSQRLHDVITLCQTVRPNITQLADRVDQPSEESGGWYSSRNKLSHLVVVDEAAFANLSGYVKIQITTDENSFGRVVETLRQDTTTEWLFKSTALINKKKATKSDRYAVAAETSDGLLFVMEKTSKHREIRKKTENTRTFRSDLVESLLNQVCNLILGDELNSINLLPYHSYSPFTKDNLQDFDYYFKNSCGAPASVITGGETAIKQWVATKLDNTLSAIEPGFKANLLNKAEECFRQGSRWPFFTNILRFDPNFSKLPSGMVDPDFYRTCCRIHEKLDSKILSFNDKSTVSLGLRQLFRIYEPNLTRYSRQVNMQFDRLDQITGFYLDNFIPQTDVESALNGLTKQLNWTPGRKNSFNTYYIPESDILIEEVISISSEAVSLIKSMASIKTYSELKTWWEFAKMHLLMKTNPSLQSKLPGAYPEMLTLNLRVFIKHVDWAMQVLESAEASFQTSEE